MSAAPLPPAAADDYCPSAAAQVRSCRSIACLPCCLPRRGGQEEGPPHDHDRPRTRNKLVVTSPSGPAKFRTTDRYAPIS